MAVAKKKARKPSAAFMKPMTPSAALGEVIGSKAMPRTEVTKKLWAYIKKNKLQDSKNRRMINSDDALKVVFGGKKSGRKPNAAFMKPMSTTSTLQAVIGSGAMPRTQVTKKLWAYIKKNGLQDSKNRRMINADDKLKAVFGGKSQVSMFDMTKLVSKHLS